MIRSRKENRRTIIIKNPETGRVREAEANIYARTMDYVEDVAFAECPEIFMKRVRNQTSATRTKYGITVTPDKKREDVMAEPYAWHLAHCCAGCPEKLKWINDADTYRNGSRSWSSGGVSGGRWLGCEKAMQTGR